jgi:putative component of membrane protein insertase Oxa1/YidC/SpoIIIJ protein YidD
MKFLILGIIQLYWLLIPEKRRRNCIFKISCSRYVYSQTKYFGFIAGLTGAKNRFYQCRPGYKVIRNGAKFICLHLNDGTKLLKPDISLKLIESECLNDQV